MEEEKLQTASDLAQSSSEEMETVKLYIERMSRSDARTRRLYEEVIAEELKHNQQFLERICELLHIAPEGYEIPEEEGDG